MKKLTLTNYTQGTTTVLENEFIDHHMTKANGEYVKVYLLILRHLNDASGTLSTSEIADMLDCTEKDVLRALKYWKKEGLLDYCEPSGETKSTPSAPAPAAGKTEPEKTAAAVSMDQEAILANEPTTSREETAAPGESASPTSIRQYRSRKERKEFKELLFVAEQYLGKTLSSVDIDTITYFFDSLHMSAELIEYLIESCVENGHKSMHYIQKVALSWSEDKVTTIAKAKSRTLQYNKNCYSILNAYGIKGRAPASSELLYIRRWNEEYGFTLDIILEACNRTMNSIHQPNFEYTDTILKNWHKKGVHHLKDIEPLDADYLKEKEMKKRQAAKPSAAPKTNKFNNFDNRSYDMSDLERRLVQQ